MDGENGFLDELGGIERIVSRLINVKVEFKSEGKAEFTQQLDDLVLQFQKELQNRHLHLDSNAPTFMDRLQSGLVLISDDCNSYLILKSNEKKSLQRTAYIEAVDATINDLLNYFKDNFAYCFNFQMRVPHSLKNAANVILGKEWNGLLPKLKSAGIDEDLLSVLSSYQHDMQLYSRSSFYELDYWYAVTNSFKKIDLEKTQDIQYDLFSQLCYLNFNYFPLLQYCIKKIQRNYDEVESYREEFIKITVQIRTLNQLIVKPNYGYNQNAETLSEALCNIMKNEIICIKKLLNINLKTLTANGAKFFLQQFYFKISISMEQFLFIFRLMIDKGIVQVKRKADLFEFIHSHVGTANKDNLSIGNMQNTYAENNRKTAIRVKVLLQSLIAQIDEKYLSLFCVLSFF
ncbi:hypothetical protein [Pedobacter sp. Hv1]|uniref:hypothetical protein n=1 Tax=Pedobacter sp. Hv1 TaxID=1740090 RepID=UPI0006D88E3F|nr:hypothetical protein [Pedobacter sp. Hv1]KQB99881.1 hypothetical protein AQF98_15315 [Pedobacter sp. Hv1]